MRSQLAARKTTQAAQELLGRHIL